MHRQTILSPCRQYRYVLWREWDKTNASYVLFVGLNPSTADETEDDPTIRRCMNYAKRWGYGALCMVNLFAYRATDPDAMKAHPQPVGTENDYWIRKMAREAGVVVAAWGVHGTHAHRDEIVKRLLGPKLTYLRKTKAGHPRHPLYLKKSLKPSAFVTSTKKFKSPARRILQQVQR